MFKKETKIVVVLIGMIIVLFVCVFFATRSANKNLGAETMITVKSVARPISSTTKALPEELRRVEIYVPYSITDAEGTTVTLKRKETVNLRQLNAIKADLQKKLDEVNEKISAVNNAL